MDLAEMPTSEIAKNPSKRASVLIFVAVRNMPHANILIFFYLIIICNSPLALPLPPPASYEVEYLIV